MRHPPEGLVRRAVPRHSRSQPPNRGGAEHRPPGRVGGVSGRPHLQTDDPSHLAGPGPPELSQCQGVFQGPFSLPAQGQTIRPEQMQKQPLPHLLHKQGGRNLFPLCQPGRLGRALHGVGQAGSPGSSNPAQCRLGQHFGSRTAVPAHSRPALLSQQGPQGHQIFRTQFLIQGPPNHPAVPEAQFSPRGHDTAGPQPGPLRQRGMFLRQGVFSQHSPLVEGRAPADLGAPA